MPTINKTFGVADPQYDSLRVFSQQALQPGAGDGAGGGLLENKIYVWHADGSTIDIFDPDETGLNAALASASMVGDTVWLPSITIALTAGVTVPVGVAITGISYNSVLSFTGFATAAMTLQAGSILQNFTLVHSDGIGVLVADNNAKVIRLHITAATAIDVDLPPVVTQANEIWRMEQRTGAVSGYALMISLDFDFTGATNTSTWTRHTTWPTGFSNGSVLCEMAMTSDGQKLYIVNDSQIWKCTNVAAIRASPSTTPTWTKIADIGDSVLGSTIDYIGRWPTGSPHGHIETWGTLLLTTAHTADDQRVYGEYDGSSWTWYSLDTHGLLGCPTYQRANYRSRPGDISLVKQPVYDETGTIIHEFGGWSGGNANDVRMWRNEVPGVVYTGTSVSGELHVVLADDGTDLYNTGYTGNSFHSLRGALLGDQIYAITADGRIVVSDDGTTFSTHSTQSIMGTYRGEMRDAHKEGGGPLILLNGNTNGNPVIQVAIGGTSDSFVTRNGNYWTVLGAASSGVIQCGAQVVFLP